MTDRFFPDPTVLPKPFQWATKWDGTQDGAESLIGSYNNTSQVRVLALGDKKFVISGENASGQPTVQIVQTNGAAAPTVGAQYTLEGVTGRVNGMALHVDSDKFVAVWDDDTMAVLQFSGVAITAEGTNVTVDADATGPWFEGADPIVRLNDTKYAIMRGAGSAIAWYLVTATVASTNLSSTDKGTVGGTGGPGGTLETEYIGKLAQDPNDNADAILAQFEIDIVADEVSFHRLNYDDSAETLNYANEEVLAESGGTVAQLTTSIWREGVSGSFQGKGYFSCAYKVGGPDAVLFASCAYDPVGDSLSLIQPTEPINPGATVFADFGSLYVEEDANTESVNQASPQHSCFSVRRGTFEFAVGIGVRDNQTGTWLMGGRAVFKTQTSLQDQAVRARFDETFDEGIIVWNRGAGSTAIRVIPIVLNT